MKDQLEAVILGRKLSSQAARALMLAALEEPVNASAASSLLTALRIHGVSVDELDGFCQALLELATPIDLSTEDILDVCGTGGDGKGTFNISTATAFILAAAGYKVAKHGNYAVSSSCGSSNVLEALGLSFTADQETLKRRLAKTNVCFLHAPLFHPAMKRVAPIRKELGFRTVFNMLGPLVNPARPTFQVNGVYDRELLRLYGYLLPRQGKRFAALLSTDGYDEVTLTAPLLVATERGSYELAPSDFGASVLQPGDILGGTTIAESATILRTILQGKGTQPQEDVVSASAGLVMWTKEGSGTLAEHVTRAREVIRSGAGATILTRSIELV
jgi:anthranilate phosphoribosyltransferase